MDQNQIENKQSNFIQKLQEMKISEIVDLVNDLDFKDIDFFYDGVLMNLVRLVF